MGDIKKRMTSSPWQRSQHQEVDEDAGNKRNPREKVQTQTEIDNDPHKNSNEIKTWLARADMPLTPIS